VATARRWTQCWSDSARGQRAPAGSPRRVSEWTRSGDTRPSVASGHPDDARQRPEPRERSSLRRVLRAARAAPVRVVGNAARDRRAEPRGRTHRVPVRTARTGCAANPRDQGDVGRANRARHPSIARRSGGRATRARRLASACGDGDGLSGADRIEPRGRGVAQLRALVDEYEPLPCADARSDPEILAAALLTAAGFATPLINAVHAGGEADLSWLVRRLIIELDSAGFHPFPQHDRIKYERWERAGWTVRRLPTNDVYDHPDRLLALARQPTPADR
jgi:hypothetical protein